MDQEIKKQLASIGVQPSKRLGQNFLWDSTEIEKILQFAAVKPSDVVVEVGPGLGALTERLAESCRELHVIEVDRRFATFLERRFAKIAGLSIHRADALEVNPGEIGIEAKGEAVLVTNAPYSISSSLFLWMLEQGAYFKRASFLFQKEFAERLAAGPDSKSYGSITVYASLFGKTKLGPIVSPEAFHPAPGVDSQLLSFEFFKEPVISAEEIVEFEKLLRASFISRRKMLINNLVHGNWCLTKEQAQKTLQDLGLDPMVRAENLSTEHFLGLWRVLKR